MDMIFDQDVKAIIKSKDKKKYHQEEG